jgi:hypothetical protein
LSVISGIVNKRNSYENSIPYADKLPTYRECYGSE